MDAPTTRILLNPLDMRSAKIMAGQIVRVSVVSPEVFSSTAIAWPSYQLEPARSVIIPIAGQRLLLSADVCIRPISNVGEALMIKVEIIERDKTRLSSLLIPYVPRIINTRLQGMIVMVGDMHVIPFGELLLSLSIKVVSTHNKTDSPTGVGRVNAETCIEVEGKDGARLWSRSSSLDQGRLEKIIKLATGQSDGNISATQGLLLSNGSGVDRQQSLPHVGTDAHPRWPSKCCLLKIKSNGPKSRGNINQSTAAALNITQVASMASLGFAEAHLALRTLMSQISKGLASVLLLEDLDALSIAAFPKVADLIISWFDFLKRGLIVASCVQSDDILPALRRSGRFDHTIPNKRSSDIIDMIGTLRSLTSCLQDRKRPCRLSKCALQLAKDTLKTASLPATFADISLIGKTSLLCSLQSQLRQCRLGSLSCYLKCLSRASVSNTHIACSQSEISREQGVDVVHWNDLGGLVVVKRVLSELFQTSLFHAPTLRSLGVASSAPGILLYGPPGCSKTMIARAIATESLMNFFVILGAELLSMWLGDSERALRSVFLQAEAASPSVIFFDEIDALALRRGSASVPGESSATDRVLAQLLVELDGIASRTHCCVVAATNRPDLLDPALMRPGRIDYLLYVPPPEFHGRFQILKSSLQQVTGSSSCNSMISQLSRCTSLCSGAEIVDICRRAALYIIGYTKKQAHTLVTPMHIFLTLSKLQISDRSKSLVFYESWHRRG